jgi:serralysin
VAAGVAGSNGNNPKVALARYNTGGGLDTSFGGDGRVTTDFTTRLDRALEVVVQTDGKIVVAGESGYGGPNPKLALARYNPDGRLDMSFSGDGKATTDFTGGRDFGWGIVIQPDGNIVVVGGAGFDGSKSTFALARYLGS